MNEYDLDILKLAGQGYCCSQIIIQMALDVQGVQNPGLIRAMSGLCEGITGSRGTCGALAGAAALLGYYAGKGSVDETENERLPLMLSELSQWFEGHCSGSFGGIRCMDIVGEGEPDSAVCGGLISACYGRALTLLVENGFDPGRIEFE